MQKAPSTLNATEIVENAIANQRLEGLQLDATTVKDLHQVSQRKLAVPEAIAHIKERLAGGDFRSLEVHTAFEKG
ncbi:hypothetical protein CSC67_07590 [Pusillimonas caeni]|uniref:hypothetical protein n=1 Tax=Pusillimonas caeni TaxID=1348472 RepID=UPI000E59BE81|nr:hypothetical protein [Pusillimonas caeni]TFL14026.1 hypothetical protein CSC67_07590 [Pusillimonas caeni]